VSPNLPQGPQEDRPKGLGAQSIGLTWTLLLVAIVLLLGQAAVGFALGRNGLPDLVLAATMALLFVSAVLNARASGVDAARRQAEFQSFNRLLQALSRSVSPGAVIDAIVHEIGTATDADHVAVVQMRPGAAVLDVNLVSMLPGSQPAIATMPLRQLEPQAARRLRTMPRVSVYPPVGDAPAPEPADPPAMRRVVVRSTEVVSRPSLWARLACRLGLSSAPEDCGDAPQPMYSPEARDLADQIAARLRDSYGLRNVLAAPLVEGEAVVGAIVVSRRVADAWPSSAVRLLNSAAGETVAALTRVYSHQAAEAEARTDLLTQLPNRRYFDEYCRLVASRRRSSDRVAILAVDVDHFKRLNDMYGHQIGDVVLRAIAGAIQMSVRDEDLPARYGGEEFMVLLRNPGPGVAVEVGERIRTNVREMDLIEAGVTDRVTVSVGVASGRAADEPISDIVERADRALYAAKRAGRDRVIEAWTADLV
jgi:diguanylate cyclase (GGDEF)-like protein